METLTNREVIEELFDYLSDLINADIEGTELKLYQNGETLYVYSDNDHRNRHFVISYDYNRQNDHRPSSNHDAQFGLSTESTIYNPSRILHADKHIMTPEKRAQHTSIDLVCYHVTQVLGGIENVDTRRLEQLPEVLDPYRKVEDGLFSSSKFYFSSNQILKYLEVIGCTHAR